MDISILKIYKQKAMYTFMFIHRKNEKKQSLLWQFYPGHMYKALNLIGISSAF